ncbi:hypothetical protein [Brevundimonas sp. GCM10030266]|uniref:hypothetical protein n=1 Tax=Brevundimonas sp. GCM10030266 TaxID=3273386 RepID=UPI0036114B5B
MRHAPAVLALSLACVAAPMTAQACVVHTPLQVEHIRYADTVVIGEVSGYRRTLSDSHRRWIREMTARDPEIGRNMPRVDGAYFDVTVERVAAGEAPRRFRVEWDAATYGYPDEMPDGRYLIGLRELNHISMSGARFMVLRRGCSGAFMFESGDRMSLAVLRVLAGKPPFPPDPPQPKPDPLAPPAPAPETLPHPPFVEARGGESEGDDVPVLYRALLGGAGLGVLTAVAALLWRGRRKPDSGDETRP